MKTTSAPTDLTVAAWPGCAPRLVLTKPGVEDLAAYRTREGYRPILGADGLLEEVELSGLVGRGGAAFPMAVKLRVGARRRLSRPRHRCRRERRGR
jgi:hypothetical protein